MFDNELTEYVTTALHHDCEHDVKVSVYKIGGGTVGRSYSGRWSYRIESISEYYTYAEGEINCGFPYTHGEVVTAALDFLEADSNA